MLACRRATASVSRFPFPPLAPDWRGTRSEPGIWPLEVLARVADVASCDLLGFIKATGRDCSLSTNSVNRRRPPAMSRAGHQRPDKLEVHVEICREIASSRSPESACRRFSYERSCLVYFFIRHCISMNCDISEADST